MAATAQNTNNTNIRSILLADKLTGLNFTNWYRNFRIVLSMSPDLQRTLEKHNAYDMMKEQKTMFEVQAKQELFKTVKAFYAYKQEEGQSVSSYLLMMKSYLDTLERLGYAMPKELGVSLILNSLNKDYEQFVENYNMHSIGKTLAELHAMQKLHEKGIPNKAKTPTMLAIRKRRIQKDKKKKPQRAKGKGKGKNNIAYDPKPKIPPPPKREHLAKDSICHHSSGSYRLLKISESEKRLELIQEEDTQPFENTSKEHTEIAPTENKRFDEEIKKIGFTQNPDEPCVYLKDSGSNVTFLVLYVDDILLIRNSVVMLQEVKSWLYKCFSIKDLGEAAYILGIKIIHDRSKQLIAFSQSAYLDKTLKKVRMKNSKKGYTSMMEKLDYKKSQREKIPIEDYFAAAKASIEAVWMRKFIDGLGGVIPSNKRPIEMLCDNEPALAIARDPRILKGAIHFQRKYHYIHEVIQQGEIVLKKVHIDDNVVDPFKKPMPLNKHFEHAMAIGIVLVSSLM
uniref:Reverse transcriptase Ty1/copia-type domain-containing protein n=1 Tax=Tanacetum cinerariifolium TaxID=118510 RepID=A0A699GME2_TANCI|nr:hypothetical protein [Tanacetum cinerariifolium]